MAKIFFRFEKAFGDAAAVAPPHVPADAKALVLVPADGSIMYFASLKGARSTAKEAKRLGIEAHLAVREPARVVRLSTVLLRMGACDEALRWVRSTHNARFAETWAACDRGDWLWWLVSGLSRWIPYSRWNAAFASFDPRDGSRSADAIRAIITADMAERAILAWWEAQS